MSWLFSVRFHIVLALALCAIGAFAGWWLLTSHQHTWMHWVSQWLLAVNIVTFAYYGADKALAARTWFFRIPETVLHMLTAIGGSPAALLAMWTFRHKTIKPAFRIVFWAIVIIQLALVGYLVVKWL